MLNPLLKDLRRWNPSWLAHLVLTLNTPEPDPDLDGWPADRVTVLRNRSPLGFGANHNQAFRHCNTEWFAVFNPDLRLPQPLDVPLLASARADIGLLAPAVLEADGRLADSARPLLTPLELVRRRFLPHRRGPAVRPPDWLAGMCLFIRSAAFREVQGFDERFFMYCEDADLSLRLQLAGWRLQYCPEGTVRHHAQRATYRSARHFSWHLRSVLRHWTSRAFWGYLLRPQRAQPMRRSVM